MEKDINLMVDLVRRKKLEKKLPWYRKILNKLF